MNRRIIFLWCFTVLQSLFFGVAHACIPDSRTLCLESGRFAVNVDWSDVSGNPKTLADTNHSGVGTARTFSDSDGGFWFYDDVNYELLVKVLNACAVNDHYWVFSAATTNVEYTLTVTDTETGQSRAYTNPQSTDAPAVTDTEAFSTCATPTTTSPAPVSPPQTIAFDPAEAGTCVPSDDTLCLFSNRFAVEATWADFGSGTGTGIAEPITNQSGLFHFFGSSNPDVILNVYDGRPKNGNFWIFHAAITNVEYEIRVTDTISGDVRTYTNGLGVTPVATLDIGPTDSFSAVYVFGDSLSDNGNINSVVGPIPFPSHGGRITNGLVAVEVFAEQLGFTLQPSLHLIGQKGGTNYAVAGARAAGDEPIDLTTQALAFLSHHNFSAPSNALYFLGFGGNDIRDARDSNGDGGAILQQAANNIEAAMRNLAAAGARQFVVMGAPNIGGIPETRLLADATNNGNLIKKATDLSKRYNKLVAAKVRAVEKEFGIQVVEFDLFGLGNNLASNASALGFTNSTDPCVNLSLGTPYPGCENLQFDEYIYFDEIHPTALMHERAGRALWAIAPHKAE